MPAGQHGTIGSIVITQRQLHGMAGLVRLYLGVIAGTGGFSEGVAVSLKGVEEIESAICFLAPGKAGENADGQADGQQERPDGMRYFN